MNSNHILWAAYFVFAALAVYFGWHPGLFLLSGPLAALKVAVWVVFAGFLGFSLYCGQHESLLETLAKMSKLHWGRQIGLDLYIGLLLSLGVVYLNHGALAALLWALPTLAFGNLAVLLYVSIYFDGIVARFIG